MSLILISSDLLLKKLERIGRNHGERNMTLLSVMHKADVNKWGEPMLGRNEVTL